MSSFEKRARETRKEQKRREKEQRRLERKAEPKGGFEVVSAEEIVGPVRSIEEVMAEIEGGPRARSAAALPTKLFVGSLSDATTSTTLRKAFEPYGEVFEAAVITDRDSGRSRGFGFVTMADRKDAPRAIEALHNSELDGRRIVVNVATERR